MTVPHIIAAVPSNRKHWKTNQCVTIGCSKNNQLLVTSRQNCSTPGIYTEVHLKQNTRYYITVSGQAVGNSHAFVFVYNPLSKQRLVPNYSFIPSKTFGCVDVEFTTPHSANEYVCIWLGVLFTSPCNGHQFCLQEIRVIVGGLSAKKTHIVDRVNTTAHVHYHPSHHHPSPHPSSPIHCPVKGNVEYCDESVYSDDSSEEIEVRHHHHHQDTNDAYHHSNHHSNHYHTTKDPYYTYGTHPCPPETKPTYTRSTSPHYEVDAETCSKTVDPVCTEPRTYEKPAQPVCIADLQSSLSSMIAQLK